MKKLRGRTTPAEIKKREDFKESLDNLFDIAHSNALALIKIQEDRDFLIAHREKSSWSTWWGKLLHPWSCSSRTLDVEGYLLSQNMVV